MRLYLELFVVVALGIEGAYQDIFSDEDHDGKCTILNSGDYQATVEMNNESYKPKGTDISRKMLTNSYSDCYFIKKTSIILN